MKTAEQERQDILDEIARRSEAHRLGAATYPDLDGVADALDELADWIKQRPIDDRAPTSPS